MSAALSPQCSGLSRAGVAGGRAGGGSVDVRPAERALSTWIWRHPSSPACGASQLLSIQLASLLLSWIACQLLDLVHSLAPPPCRLCVSITDYGIRVLAMPSGEVLHNLSIHTSERGGLGAPRLPGNWPLDLHGQALWMWPGILAMLACCDHRPPRPAAPAPLPPGQTMSTSWSATPPTLPWPSPPATTALLLCGTCAAGRCCGASAGQRGHVWLLPAPSYAAYRRHGIAVLLVSLLLLHPNTPPHPQPGPQPT